MATATELVQLGEQYNSLASQIDDFIDSQPNPYSPTFLDLRNKEANLANAANNIATLAIVILTPEIAAATNQLTSTVASAQAALKTITNIQKWVNVVAAVLQTAVSAATGNPFAAAGDVLNLVQTIGGALS
jgi:hypothetical protein